MSIGIFVLVPDADQVEVNTPNDVLIPEEVWSQNQSDATR
jgi:hypothetical protein